MNKLISVLVSLTFVISSVYSQKKSSYDLSKLLTQDKPAAQEITLLDSGGKNGVTGKGVFWLKNVNFTDGTVDVDLRGRNVFLQSFLGIAFHGVDTSSYEVVFFRPFNFRHSDTLRRKWSVQYMRWPDYLYDKLRREHPLVYENAVLPVPEPAGWFHATIVIKEGWITVYVDHCAQPCLRVKKLGGTNNGNIALWDDPGGLSGDFANLVITK